MKRNNILSKSLVLSSTLALLLTAHPSQASTLDTTPPFAEIHTQTLSSGYISASWRYSSFVDGDYTPSDNQIKFDFGTGGSRIFTEATTTLQGENSDCFTIVGTTGDTISKQDTFYIELKPNLSSGTYTANLQIYTKETGTVNLEPFTVTVRDNATSNPDTTTPDTTTPDTTTPDTTTPETTTPDTSTPDSTTPDTTTPDSTTPETTTPDTTTPDSTTPETTTPDSTTPDTTTPETTTPDTSTPDTSTPDTTTPDTTTPDITTPDTTTPDITTPDTNTDSNNNNTGSDSSTNVESTTKEAMADSKRSQNMVARSDGGYDIVYLENVMTVVGSSVDYTKSLLVRQYNSTFQHTGTKTLSVPMGSFEAAYFNDNYNFLVFTDTNTSESNSKEVLRLVKYSKDWQVLGSASVSGVNTVSFSWGNFSFAESNDTLYIHTAHLMYKSDDGYNHQANITLAIDLNTMTLKDSQHIVWNSTTGYVSHSFAQDILVDSDGYLVRFDLGDARPRGAYLTRTNSPIDSTTLGRNVSNVTLATWSGDTGNNLTGALTTDLVETKAGYLSAYLDSGKGGSYVSGDTYSAYIAYTPKTSFTSSSTVKNTVTTNTHQGGVDTSGLRLIATSEEGGIALFDKSTFVNGSGYSCTLYYGTYDAYGKVSGITAVNDTPISGRLSSFSEPLVVGDTIYLYASSGTTNNSPVVYQIKNKVLSQVIYKDGTTTDTSTDTTTGSTDTTTGTTDTTTGTTDTTTGTTDTTTGTTDTTTGTTDTTTGTTDTTTGTTDTTTGTTDTTTGTTDTTTGTTDTTTDTTDTTTGTTDTTTGTTDTTTGTTDTTTGTTDTNNAPQDTTDTIPLTGASSWATTLITEASELGLLDGMSDITSKYKTSISREEFCRLIMNVYESTGKTVPTGSNPFTDTSHPDVIAANQLGIVTGTSETTFTPNSNITRQELAVMIQRTAEHFESISNLNSTTSFADDSNISFWAKESVFYAEREGFLAGSDGNILPKDNLTCEQAISVALRLAQKFA